MKYEGMWDENKRNEKKIWELITMRKIIIKISEGNIKQVKKFRYLEVHRELVVQSVPPVKKNKNCHGKRSIK